MAAREGLRLGQALLRRAAFRPQTLIGIRKGNFFDDLSHNWSDLVYGLCQNFLNFHLK